MGILKLGTKRRAQTMLLVLSIYMSACSGMPRITGQEGVDHSVSGELQQSSTFDKHELSASDTPTWTPEPTALPTETPLPTPSSTPTLTPTPTPVPLVQGPFSYGMSYLGYPLLYFRVGSGARARMLVGGIHGGYELNTVILMNEFLDHLEENPEFMPPELTLYIVPCANPDGAIGGPGRLEGRVNGNDVDLNRNWDYRWQPTSNHGQWPVSAGSAPFSEPESADLRDLILEEQVEAVIIYHSAMAAVFQGVGISTSDTVELALLMVEATGYRYAPTEVNYPPTTGNAIDWLTLNGITTAEIELTNHQDIDWAINWNGLMAFLQWNLND